METMLERILKFVPERDWEQFHNPRCTPTGILDSAGINL